VISMMREGYRMLRTSFMQRSTVLGGLLALAVGCAGHAGHSVALYEAGDYTGAARTADAELAAHPGDEALWQMRIRAALALGDAAGVAKTYAAYRARQGGEDDRELLRDLAIATLGQALTAPSVKLKIAAIEAIEAAELEPLADQVAQRMRDDDDRVIATAAVAVLHGAPDAGQAVGDMLRSEDAEARRIAVEGTGKKIGKPALGFLEAAGADPDPRVRRAALRWLGQLRDQAAVPLLTQRLRDPEEAVRSAAASALARIGPIGQAGAAQLVELARTALADRALAVRLAGIELLAAAHATGELTALADDRDPTVATEAAIAAGAGPAAARAAERAASSPEWAVRAGAANLATRALGKDAALALANRLAADPELAVRLAAARVLATQPRDRAAAVAIFAAALATDHQIDAAVDLAMQDDPRGAQALDDAVRDPVHGAAHRAAAATAHRTAHRITPGLVAALADDSGAVRVEAAAALALLTRH
jgi:HEAT repeat protein